MQDKFSKDASKNICGSLFSLRTSKEKVFLQDIGLIIKG